MFCSYILCSPGLCCCYKLCSPDLWWLLKTARSAKVSAILSCLRPIPDPGMGEGCVFQVCGGLHEELCIAKSCGLGWVDEQTGGAERVAFSASLYDTAL